MGDGFIYKVTCIPTGKMYVGQAKEYKMKYGKPYKYGISGRWSDHISSSKKSSTAFAKAIQEHGRDAFQLEELEKGSLSSLDALEAKWIHTLQCVVPNGYNTARHSQNRHTDESNLVLFFKDRADHAILRKIMKGTDYKLVYIYIYLKDKSMRRVVFGQNENDTFDHALQEARTFLHALGCPHTEDTSHSSVPLERYASKLQELSTKTITQIRITSASHLIAVYVTTDDMKCWKDQLRICFGGKTIPKDFAYDIACQFVTQLPKTETTVILDKCQSPQQVAATTGEASPS